MTTLEKKELNSEEMNCVAGGSSISCDSPTYFPPTETDPLVEPNSTKEIGCPRPQAPGPIVDHLEKEETSLI